MVDTLDTVQKGVLARHVEAHMHDVALGGAQHDALHPLLVLEGADIGADDLDARVREHGSGVGPPGHPLE